MTKRTQLGLMSGFLAMLFITVLYIYNPHSLIDGYERLTLLIFFGTMIYAVVQRRQTNLSASKIEDLLEDEAKGKDESQDFASFGELLQLGFRIYVIAFFLKFLFVYFLFNFYDPSLVEMVKDANVELFMQHKDPSETEAIFQAKLAQFKEGEFGPQLTDIMGISMELIVGFLMAFILALIFRREQPEY